jgi:hypothetical protein
MFNRIARLRPSAWGDNSWCDPPCGSGQKQLVCQHIVLLRRGACSVAAEGRDRSAFILSSGEPTIYEASDKSGRNPEALEMSRRKHERTARLNERDWHLVQLVLPPGGLGEGDLAITGFHKERGIQPRFGHVRRYDGELCVTLCFADPTEADAFQRRFGGTRIVCGY